MNDNDQQRIVDDLLADWEIARENGQDIPIGELCADAPELREQVEQGIAKLNATSWLMLQADGESGQPKKRSADTYLPNATLTMDEFVESVNKCGILSDSDLKKVRQHANAKESSVSELAERLIEEDVLTRYQARVLLKNGKSPLLLDRYIILDKLGEGGMGIVFKALHRAMERIVALKVLPEFATNSQEKISRFQREIRAVAKISHPNVVAAYDAHQSDGNWFLVMEYVEGQNLNEFVEEHGPLTVDKAVEVLGQIGAGLAASHRQGIIHRDIKPSNIMLSSDGVAKLLDLGLSRTKRIATEASATKLTTEGIAMGTVDYMSPEQAVDAKEADARADIYSLGCSLFYLLTGRAPFESSAPVKTIVAHREQDAPLLKSTQEDIPDWLQQIYRKMVAKNPEDRQSSVNELVNELTERKVGTSPSAAISPRKSPANGQRKEKQPQTSRFSVPIWKPVSVLVAIGVLVIAAFEIGSLWQPENDDDIQRNVAKWILNNKGTLSAETDFEVQHFSDASELPDGKFVIQRVLVRGDGGEQNIEPLSKLNGIQDVTLSFCDSDFSAISHLHDLDALSLMDCVIDKQDIEVIESFANLTSLRLISCKVEGENLAFVRKLKKLELLDFAAMTIDLSQDLDQLKWLPELNSLYLRRTSIDDSDLAKLPGWLRDVDVSGTLVTDDCAKHFKKLTNLESIGLGFTAITDDCLAELSTLRKLSFINLNNTNVTLDGLRSLHAFPELSRLSLEYWKITPETIDVIMSFDGLTELSLSGSDLDNNGITRLVTKKNLKWIEAHNTNVTPATRTDLSITHPDVRIR